MLNLQETTINCSYCWSLKIFYQKILEIKHNYCICSPPKDNFNTIRSFFLSDNNKRKTILTFSMFYISNFVEQYQVFSVTVVSSYYKSSFSPPLLKQTRTHTLKLMHAHTHMHALTHVAAHTLHTHTHVALLSNGENCYTTEQQGRP